MEIKDLSSLRRHVGGGGGGVAGKEQQAEVVPGTSKPSSRSSSENEESKLSVVEPTFGGSRCKLFELAEAGYCRVFLAYQLQPDQDEPSVWLYSTSTTRWHQLADSFSKYFRMMLVHLGLPLWQICAAGLPLPTWLEQVYVLVGPNLLSSVLPSPCASAESSLWSDGPTNLIDPLVFRGKEYHHGIRQKPTTTSTTTAGGGNTTTTTTTTTTSNTRKKSSSH